MNSVKEEIAKNLQFYRKKMKLTQKDLADKLGVKHNTISQWENCQNSIDVDTLVAICEILEITFDDIYGRFANGSISVSAEAKKIAMLYDKASDDDKNIVGLTLKKYEDVQVIRIAARDGQKDIELTGEQRKAIVDMVQNLDNDDDNSDI